MKYSVEIEIDQPVDRVIELFDNTENMYKWMKGLQSFEPISGKASEPGAKSRLRFKMGRREIEMIETVTSKNLPEEYSGTYETDGVFNRVTNRFISLGKNKTKWVSENEFEFASVGMKLMSFFMPWAFKKQTRSYLRNFKEFAESAV